jgi:predicted metal-dependent hydrolase
MTQDLHPELRPDERRQLFWRGIELFNHGELFACHEAWEEIWRSTTTAPRDLFQGLIQVAVGLYHFQVRQRPDVAERVLAKGQRRLKRVTTSPHGLDLQRLLDEVKAWRSWLVKPSGEPPPVPQLVVTKASDVR